MGNSEDIVIAIKEVKPKKPKSKAKKAVTAKPKGKAKAPTAKRKPKLKKFKLPVGSFMLDEAGNVINKTKSIDKVSRGRTSKANEYTVTLVFKAK